MWWSMINNSNEKNNFSMSSLYNNAYFVCLKKGREFDKVHLWPNKLKIKRKNIPNGIETLYGYFRSVLCLMFHIQTILGLWGGRSSKRTPLLFQRWNRCVSVGLTMQSTNYFTQNQKPKKILIQEFSTLTISIDLVQFEYFEK